MSRPKISLHLFTLLCKPILGQGRVACPEIDLHKILK